MRNIITIILSAIALASCTLETSGNGDLDGFWHLTSIDTLSTGGKADYSERQVYWMFQGKLYRMREYIEGTAIVGHFKENGDSLFITDVHRDDRMYDDPAITNVAEVRVYGVNAIGEHYSIVKLSSSKMELKSKTLKLHFKKQ